MIARRVLSTFTTAASLAALVACGGGNTPGIDQVKQDFNSPSGSTKDQTALLAATGKQQGSDAALAIGAGANTLIPGAGALRAEEHPFAKYNWARLLAPQIEAMKAQVRGRKALALTGNPISGCGQAVAQAYAQSAGSGNVSGGATGGSYSFEVSIDLASCGQGATGKITMKVEAEADVSNQSAPKVSFSVEQKFENVCETSGRKTCVNGDFLAQAEFGANITGGSGSFVTAWNVSTTWEENGKARKTTAKGGIRIAATGSSGSLEYLFYVTDSTGKEVSLVITLTNDGEGNAALKIKGSDGEVTCVQKADGSGQCTAQGSSDKITWTTEQFEAAASLGFDKS